MSARPPRVAELLVRSLLPREERDELLGDLRERYTGIRHGRGAGRAVVWYWAQALGALPRLAHVRLSAAPRRRRLAATRAWRPAALGRPFRILRREPGFAFVAAGVLALGIGVPTTMYAIERGIFRALPVARAERVVAVQRIEPRTRRDVGFTPAAFEAIRDRSTAAGRLAAYRTGRVQIDGWDGAPVLESGATLSPAAIPLLGVEPLLGRWLVEGDAGPSAPAVVAIGERLWRDGFGRRPDVLAHVVRVDGVPRTVVGVMPAGFGFPVNARVWLPLRTDVTDPTAGPVRMVARLRDGVSVARARETIDALVRGLDASRPGGDGVGPDRLGPAGGSVADGPAPVTALVPFQDTFLGDGTVARAILALFFLVAAIAAANVANLLLSRAVRRRRETAVRMAIGGTRARIVIEHLGEALVLSMVGVPLGVALSWLGLLWFRASFAVYVDVWWVSLRLDAGVVLFAALSGVLVALLAGVAPALQASGVAIAGAMRSGSSGRSFHRSRFSRASIAAQLALCCALLILVAQIVRGIGRSPGAGDGLDSEGVLAGLLHLGSFDYPGARSRVAFARGLEGLLTALPGASGAALMTGLPGRPAPLVPVAIEGAATAPAAPPAQLRRVTPSFFPLFHVEPVTGRVFEETAAEPVPVPDRTAGGPSPVEAVVDERLAHLLAPEGGAVGLRVTLPGIPAGSAVVVGVVRDAGVSVDREGVAQPGLFIPLAAAVPADLSYAVRGAGGVRFRDVSEAVRGVDPRVPLFGTGTLADLSGEGRSLERRFATLLALFGAVAFALALAGLHAVVAFSVRSRARDIGIERALGASPARALRSTLRGVGRALAAGLAAGAAFAFVAAPAIAPMFGGGGVRDPATFLAVPAAVAAVVVLAAAVAGRKAASVDLSRALASE